MSEKFAETVLAHKNKLFGYWITANDEISAAEAIRMAGLPVLIMGANAALLTLIGLVHPMPNVFAISVSALTAVLLVILAFRVRAGAAAWMPVILVLFCVFFLVGAYRAYLNWNFEEQSWVFGAQSVLNWIAPLICMSLVLAGFKGWLWLRTNGVKRSF